MNSHSLNGTDYNMIKRGSIYFVELNPVKGREQAGKRPVLVVSDDAINSRPLVVTVVVGTDASNIQEDYPTNVRVTAKETGLPRDTVFLCFQIRSLDPERFVNSRSGKVQEAAALPEHRMREVEDALRLVLRL